MAERWYKEAVVYSLEVQSFQDSDGDGVGDFRGLVSRLDYLARLGVTCLWLNPIHPSPGRDDGYDVSDFYGVHPALGTLGDFAELKLISYEAFDALFASFRREALHLEMRDAYGTEVELPHLRKWLAGEPDDTGWLEPWFALVRAGTAAGKVFKRARIVSEPVSDYQKWVLQDSHRYVQAGEDIRWVPRGRVSAVALPGNDFWLFDDEVVVFLIFAANGLVVDRRRTTDPSVIQLCRSAFEAVWELSIPDRGYHPQ